VRARRRGGVGGKETTRKRALGRSPDYPAGIFGAVEPQRNVRQKREASHTPLYFMGTGVTVRARLGSRGSSERFFERRDPTPAQ
jgi:hypothetical protein